MKKIVRQNFLRLTETESSEFVLDEAMEVEVQQDQSDASNEQVELMVDRVSTKHLAKHLPVDQWDPADIRLNPLWTTFLAFVFFFDENKSRFISSTTSSDKNKRKSTCFHFRSTNHIKHSFNNRFFSSSSATVESQCRSAIFVWCHFSVLFFTSPLSFSFDQSKIRQKFFTKIFHNENFHDENRRKINERNFSGRIFPIGRCRHDRSSFEEKSIRFILKFNVKKNVRWRRSSRKLFRRIFIENFRLGRFRNDTVGRRTARSRSFEFRRTRLCQNAKWTRITRTSSRKNLKKIRIDLMKFFLGVWSTSQHDFRWSWRNDYDDWNRWRNVWTNLSSKFFSTNKSKIRSEFFVFF